MGIDPKEIKSVSRRVICISMFIPLLLLLLALLVLLALLLMLTEISQTKTNHMVSLMHGIKLKS